MAYVLYAVLSFICAMSETIYFFVAARILLGLAGGVILPIGQSVLLNEYPEKLRTFGVGIWGVLGMMPFMVGIFIGGWWAGTFRLALFVLLEHPGRAAGRRRRGLACCTAARFARVFIASTLLAFSCSRRFF